MSDHAKVLRAMADATAVRLESIDDQTLAAAEAHGEDSLRAGADALDMAEPLAALRTARAKERTALAAMNAARDVLDEKRARGEGQGEDLTTEGDALDAASRAVDDAQDALLTALDAEATSSISVSVKTSTEGPLSR